MPLLLVFTCFPCSRSCAAKFAEILSRLSSFLEHVVPMCFCTSGWSSFRRISSMRSSDRTSDCFLLCSDEEKVIGGVFNPLCFVIPQYAQKESAVWPLKSFPAVWAGVSANEPVGSRKSLTFVPWASVVSIPWTVPDTMSSTMYESTLLTSAPCGATVTVRTHVQLHLDWCLRPAGSK